MFAIFFAKVGTIIVWVRTKKITFEVNTAVTTLWATLGKNWAILFQHLVTLINLSGWIAKLYNVTATKALSIGDTPGLNPSNGKYFSVKQGWDRTVRFMQ